MLLMTGYLMIVQNGLHLNKGYGSFCVTLTDCKALQRSCSYFLRGRPYSFRCLDLLQGIEKASRNGAIFRKLRYLLAQQKKKTLQTEERELIWVSQGRHSNKCTLLFPHKITQPGKSFL